MSRSSNNQQQQPGKKHERASSVSLADASQSFSKPISTYTGEPEDAKSHFDPSPIKKSPSPIKKFHKSKGSKCSKGASDQLSKLTEALLSVDDSPVIGHKYSTSAANNKNLRLN